MNPVTRRFADYRFYEGPPTPIAYCSSLTDREIKKIVKYWEMFEKLQDKKMAYEKERNYMAQMYNREEEVKALNDAIIEIQNNHLYLEQEYENYIISVGLQLRDYSMNEILFNFINSGLYEP